MGVLSLDDMIEGARIAAQAGGENPDNAEKIVRGEWSGLDWESRPCEYPGEDNHEIVMTEHVPKMCKHCGRGSLEAMRGRMERFLIPKSAEDRKTVDIVVRNCGGCQFYSDEHEAPMLCGHPDGKHPTNSYATLVRDIRGPDHLPSDCPLRVRTLEIVMRIDKG